MLSGRLDGLHLLQRPPAACIRRRQTASGPASRTDQEPSIRQLSIHQVRQTHQVHPLFGRRERLLCSTRCENFHSYQSGVSACPITAIIADIRFLKIGALTNPSSTMPQDITPRGVKRSRSPDYGDLQTAEGDDGESSSIQKSR